MLRLVPFVLAFTTACGSDAANRESSATTKKDAAGNVAVDSTAKRIADSSAKSSAVIDSVAKATTTKHAADRAAEKTRETDAPGVVLRRGDPGPSIIRALYVNRWAAQSRKRMAKLVAAADSTEINALVIDMKDEFGLNYKTQNPEFAKNGGSASVANVRALLDTLKKHDIFAIARLVVFKDSVTARVHPEWTIRRTDNSIWRDHKGIAWVNPYHHELWDYNIGVAEELVKLGFDEVQFDYIRFPEPYASLPKQVFPSSKDVSKPDAIAAFLKEAKERINKYGVRSTADVFGLVTQVSGPLEVAQHWERISPVVDVVLPMVYPSHYPRGEMGIPRPNAEPYKVILAAISRARERDKKLGIGEPEHVRPWLQAFSLGKPPYGAAELEAQKKAVYDSGYDGWVLWNPGSIYDVFMPALEKKLTTRKKTS